MKRAFLALAILVLFLVPTSAFADVHYLSDYNGALANAVTSISATTLSSVTLVVDVACSITADLSIPENIALQVIDGAYIGVNPHTLTINGPFQAGPYLTFSIPSTSSGTVIFGPGSVEQILPQWWGALGDSQTDNRVPINNALTTAGASGGGVVYLPAGNYHTSGTLTVFSNTTLLGAGMGATTITNARWKGTFRGSSVCGGDSCSPTVGAFGASNVIIQNLTVDGYTLGGLSNSIEFGFDKSNTPTSNSTIDTCEVWGGNSHQYLIWLRKATNCTVMNCVVDGKNTGIPSSLTDTNGIEAYWGSGIVIKNNKVSNLNTAGIELFSGNASNILIDGNTVSNCTFGVYMISAVSQPLKNITVVNNSVTSAVRASYQVVNSPNSEIDSLHFSNNYSYYPGEPVLRRGGGGDDPSVLGYGFNLFGDKSAISNDIVLTNNYDIGSRSTNTGSYYILYMNNVTLSQNQSYSPAYTNIMVIGSNNSTFSENIFDSATTISIYATEMNGSKILNNTITNYDTSHNGSVYNSAIYAPNNTNCTIGGNSLSRPNGGIGGYAINAGDSDASIMSGNSYIGRCTDLANVWIQGTNPNYGLTDVMTALSTTVITANTQVTSVQGLSVNQVAGTPIPFVVTTNPGVSFTVTIATGAAGDEQFSYQIVQ